MIVEKILLTAVCIILTSSCQVKSIHADHPATKNSKILFKTIEEVSYQQVKITDNFWKPRIDKNRIAGIRSALREAASNIENFDIAAGKKKGEHDQGGGTDSNVYKIIQGIAYALSDTPDAELEATADSLIERIIAAQLPDGYLFTEWIIKDISKRWTDIPKKHELYCAGHMFEAAVAYYEVTGKRRLLDASIRFADHIDSVFGPNKRLAAPGHQEIELALYKLYKTTGEKRYLELSSFFIDERGNPNRMTAERLSPPDKDPRANTPHRWRSPAYMQDHLPVTQQFHAVGHAVRATYLYSAMTDISIEKKDTKYLVALDSIWNDIVGKKIYITGGIGTRQFHDEGFGSAYQLPSDQAYAETCSNIGLNFWNRRMNRLHGHSKYADLVELTMYNSAISSVSLSGTSFFYTNPLESNGKLKRHTWSNPPCCPTNIVRFLPEIGSTIYGKTKDGIYINQFIGNNTEINIANQKISMLMETNYPWGGRISLKVDPESPVDLALHFRIPGWAQGELLPGGLYQYLDDETNPFKEVVLKINGSKIQHIDMQNGYAVIQRKWKKGDEVELELPMKVRLMTGNTLVESTHGKAAIMRGPVVYCIEETDNKSFFEDPDSTKLVASGLNANYRNDLLEGVVTISGFASCPSKVDKMNITAVPYYAWSNRDQGQMKVWLPFLFKD